MRVCIRIGTRRWPERCGHLLAYVLDVQDSSAGLILLWDLTADTQDLVPRLTARQKTGWTRRATMDERDQGLERLTFECDEAIESVSYLD